MCLIHDGNIVLALGLGTMSNCWCMETGETRRLDIERRNIDVRARCHADITVEHTLWTHKPSKTSVPHCSLGTCCWGGDNWRKLHSVDMAWNGNMNTGNKVAKTQPIDTRGCVDVVFIPDWHGRETKQIIQCQGYCDMSQCTWQWQCKVDPLILCLHTFHFGVAKAMVVNNGKYSWVSLSQGAFFVIIES